MADWEEKFKLKYVIFCFLIICNIVEGNIISFQTSKHVEEFKADDLAAFKEQRIESVNKLFKREVIQDSRCAQQNKTFHESLEQNVGKQICQTHVFPNQHTAMSMAWADNGVMIVVTNDILLDTSLQSSVFRSIGHGKTFVDLSRRLDLEHGKNVIKKHNGVQRHAYNFKKVYLIGVGKYMFTFKDDGLNFDKIDLTFLIDGDLVFNQFNDDYIIALSDKKELFVSKNNGMTWKQLEFRDKQRHADIGVDKVAWGVKPDDEFVAGSSQDTKDTIYFTHGLLQTSTRFSQFRLPATFTLAKSTDCGDSYTDILENVVSFERKGKFLYAFQMKNTEASLGSSRQYLLVSVDGGNVFREAQLPSVEPNRFFSVIDVEDNMMFMHVDDPGDTGRGTLYTSANQGIVFSLSLTRHLFPNFNKIQDFYKVKSMRGVYITSQMRDDNSIHTMITYDRGGEWQNIPRPEGVPCKDETKSCFLQIHGMYSLERGIRANLPISEKTAPGLILVHAHVAESLQTTDPDVFISRDGGYTWNLSLKGPHHYQIGDHGGLLVAVSKSEPSPNIIKFSSDEGRCWHDYNFTNRNIKFTGLVIEPEGKGSVVMIWGYEQATKNWVVNVINFKDVITKQCGDMDYEPWLAHHTQRANEGNEVRGCLLGIKETFLRLKKDSWCYNGFLHELVRIKKEYCTCTREDYVCDKGYFRPENSNDCVDEPEIPGNEINICLTGHEETIISEGLRKLPGDRCVNGFKPTTKLIDLSKICDEFGNKKVEEDDGKEMTTRMRPTGQNGTIIMTSKPKDTITIGPYHVDSDDDMLSKSDSVVSSWKLLSTAIFYILYTCRM